MKAVGWREWSCSWHCETQRGFTTPAPQQHQSHFLIREGDAGGKLQVSLKSLCRARHSATEVHNQPVRCEDSHHSPLCVLIILITAHTDTSKAFLLPCYTPSFVFPYLVRCPGRASSILCTVAAPCTWMLGSLHTSGWSHVSSL